MVAARDDAGNGLRNLLSPIRIGSMTVKNRIVMAPMGTNYTGTDGLVNDRFRAFVRARAMGGVGLIVLEAAHVHPSGRVSPTELAADRDDVVEGLRSLVADAHRFGAMIAMQLGHAGRQTHQAVTGRPLLAPSPIPCPLCQEIPVEMTASDIGEIVAAFGEAAARAKAAGFDAVEIHGAHGYLVNQFLSSYSNRRKDEYGGSLENRARFPLAVLRRIKEKVGAGYPVIHRLSSAEFVADGLTIEETTRFAAMLAADGIDAIHVSGGVYESAGVVIGPQCVPQGIFVPNAAAIRGAVGGKVPIIVVGRIKNPVMAEQVLAAGQADLVAMGRALLADDALPAKAAQGRLDEIRPCIACNQGCIDRYFAGEGITCLGNPLAGRESEFDPVAKAATRKRVLVVGGGPAGLEASAVAARLGHDVVLLERSDRLGGQMNVASRAPFKAEIDELTAFLVARVRSSGVEIRLDQELTAEALDRIRPDITILATGSIPAVPGIKGIDGTWACSAGEILSGAVEAVGNVAVVGGGMVGCETAEFLADKGLKVTLIEMLDQPAADMGMINRAMLLMRLNQKGVRILPGTTVKEVRGDKSLVVETTGRTDTIGGIDFVVTAVGYRSDSEAQALLEKVKLPYERIGDCLNVAKMLGAIHQGFLCACRI